METIAVPAADPGGDQSNGTTLEPAVLHNSNSPVAGYTEGHTNRLHVTGARWVGGGGAGLCAESGLLQLGFSRLLTIVCLEQCNCID